MIDDGRAFMFRSRSVVCGAGDMDDESLEEVESSVLSLCQGDDMEELYLYPSDEDYGDVVDDVMALCDYEPTGKKDRNVHGFAAWLQTTYKIHVHTKGRSCLPSAEAVQDISCANSKERSFVSDNATRSVSPFVVGECAADDNSKFANPLFDSISESTPIKPDNGSKEMCELTPVGALRNNSQTDLDQVRSCDSVVLTHLKPHGLDFNGKMVVSSNATVTTPARLAADANSRQHNHEVGKTNVATADDQICCEHFESNLPSNSENVASPNNVILAESNTKSTDNDKTHFNHVLDFATSPFKSHCSSVEPLHCDKESLNIDCSSLAIDISHELVIDTDSLKQILSTISAKDAESAVVGEHSSVNNVENEKLIKSSTVCTNAELKPSSPENSIYEQDKSHSLSVVDTDAAGICSGVVEWKCTCAVKSCENGRCKMQIAGRSDESVLVREEVATHRLEPSPCADAQNESFGGKGSDNGASKLSEIMADIGEAPNNTIVVGLSHDSNTDSSYKMVDCEPSDDSNIVSHGSNSPTEADKTIKERSIYDLKENLNEEADDLNFKSSVKTSSLNAGLPEVESPKEVLDVKLSPQDWQNLAAAAKIPLNVPTPPPPKSTVCWDQKCVSQKRLDFTEENTNTQVVYLRNSSCTDVSLPGLSDVRNSSFTNSHSTDGDEQIPSISEAVANFFPKLLQPNSNSHGSLLPIPNVIRFGEEFPFVTRTAPASCQANEFAGPDSFGSDFPTATQFTEDEFPSSGQEFVTSSSASVYGVREPLLPLLSGTRFHNVLPMSAHRPAFSTDMQYDDNFPVPQLSYHTDQHLLHTGSFLEPSEQACEAGAKVYNRVKLNRDFISDDPHENEDNSNPSWDVLRMLATDDERYRAVRQRWRNILIPDPCIDLTSQTFRLRRMHLCPGQNPAVNGRALAPTSRKRLASNENLQSQAKRYKREILCTETFDSQLGHLEDDYRNRVDRFEELYRREHSSLLNAVRTQANLMHSGQHNGRRTENRRYQFARESLYELEQNHKRKLDDMDNEYRSKSKKLKTARNEVLAFHAFYANLKNSANVNVDTRKLNRDVQEEMCECDNMYALYPKLYV